MERNTSKEKWISGVMESTTGMKKAQPLPGLYDRVTANLNYTQDAKSVRIPVTQWAAAAILLVSLNIGSVIYFTKQNNAPVKAGATNPLADEMQLETTYNY